jgi:hypothetical protein
MPSPNLTLINVVHEEDGLFTNATLSIINAQPKATFSFTQDGQEFTNDIDLNEEDFESLWSKFNQPVFVRCAVRSPSTPLDLRRNYIIGIIYNINGDAGKMTYLIHHNESDPTWLDWLRKFESLQRPS